VIRPEQIRRLLAAVVVAASVATCGSPSVTSSPNVVDSPSLAPASPSPSSAASLAASATPTETGAASTPAPSSNATAEPVAVLIGAGDICRVSYLSAPRSTAALVTAELTANPSAVPFTLGDNSNDQGTAAQYKACFDKTWGAFKSRIHPVAGNHDQYTSNGAPYYAYFGAAAGPAGKGYYSYDVAANWHVVVLNGICGKAGGCGKGSKQEVWLRADLAANKGKHILAMWHPPSFSSGWHGSTSTYITWWRDLYAAGAEIVLSGHDHDYERFARQAPDGKADPRGIRQFVVGTGGAFHSPFGTVRPHSEARSAFSYGVLRLTLRTSSYSWQFIPAKGSSFTDSGTTATHF
jgi:acid phosphatase type 7